MLGVAHAKGCTNIFYNLHIVLHISGKCVDIVVYVAACCREKVITPVGTDNRCCLVIEMKYAFQFSLIVFLRLVAYEVSHVVGLRCHLIEVSVVVVVVNEIEEHRVFAHFIFCACFPTPSFAAHVIIGTSGNVFARLGTVGEFIAV